MVPSKFGDKIIRKYVTCFMFLLSPDLYSDQMTDHLSQSCTGEQGGYESSSYSFVGVSEQGSLADADDVSEHALAQTGVFPDDTLVILAFCSKINSSRQILSQ